MKIKILRNLGRGLYPYREGQVVEASEAEAENLCKLGLAEVIEAVPPKAAFVKPVATPPIEAVPPTKPITAKTKLEDV